MLSHILILPIEVRNVMYVCVLEKREGGGGGVNEQDTYKLLIVFNVTY
jgi:hypothetical protein